jgi:anti-anti-sigma regulatory factor
VTHFRLSKFCSRKCIEEGFELDCQITEHDGVHWVYLSGVINEDSEIPLKDATQSLEGATTVCFNFKDVQSVNSLGVRAWVTFLRGVESAAERQVYFYECVPDVIMQINMIPSFVGKAQIASFYVNYVSPATNKTHKILIETANLEPQAIPPAPNCPETGTPMETEELEEEYFAFLMR